jgi:hypothetical protein
VTARQGEKGVKKTGAAATTTSLPKDKETETKTETESESEQLAGCTCTSDMKGLVVSCADAAGQDKNKQGSDSGAKYSLCLGSL